MYHKNFKNIYYYLSFIHIKSFRIQKQMQKNINLLQIKLLTFFSFLIDVRIQNKEQSTLSAKSKTWSRNLERYAENNSYKNVNTNKKLNKNTKTQNILIYLQIKYIYISLSIFIMTSNQWYEVVKLQ